MKTISEIKDEVAKRKGTDWNELMSDCGGNPDDIQDYTDEVAKRYAEEALKEAAEIRHEFSYGIVAIDKKSILNIIKELK